MEFSVNKTAPGAATAIGAQSAPTCAAARTAGKPEFAELLNAAVKKAPATETNAQTFEATALKFSAHAQSRLKSRNIDMSPQIMEKLTSAVQGAAQKGSNNSLILLSDLAFIVNIPNRTVVTALDGESIRENVFTNIDSTVLAR